MDPTVRLGPDTNTIKALTALWDTILDWFSDDEKAVATSSYQAAAPAAAPDNGMNGAPLPVVARDCNPASIPPENIELRHKPMNGHTASGCTYVESTSAPTAKAPEKPDCRASYIPFEAVEYRYGNMNGIMHLPICMSK